MTNKRSFEFRKRNDCYKSAFSLICIDSQSWDNRYRLHNVDCLSGVFYQEKLI